jgi:hypothetical protein
VPCPVLGAGFDLQPHVAISSTANIRDSEDRLVLISAKLHTNPNATQTLMELALQISSMLNAVDMAGTPKQDELRILPVPPEKMLGA